MKRPNPSQRTNRFLGRALIALGVLIASICLGLMGYARTGTVAANHRWSGDPIYLTSTVRGSQHRCTITPENGDVRDVNVPAMPNRGPHIDGQRLDAWFIGSADIVCADPVRITVGQAVRLYPLVEQWLVLLLGLLLAGIGLSRFGLFQHTSRYP